MAAVHPAESLASGPVSAWGQASIAMMVAPGREVGDIPAADLRDIRP